LKNESVPMSPYVDAFLPKVLELSPFEWYRAMRESSPIRYEPHSDCWQVFRYDEVQRVANDPAIFSSSGRLRQNIADENRPGIQSSLINMDPPDHRCYRNLVTQAFTPRAVARLAPRIADLASELLGTAIATGTLDVVTDFAYPLPVIVIAELLGVRAEDRPRFKWWSDTLIAADPNMLDASDDPEHWRRRRQDAIRPVTGEMRAYFGPILAARRVRPQPDLISDLVASEIEGQRLTEDELVGFCTLLLIAGNITTTNLLGNAMVCFEEHPMAVATLEQHPDLMPSAVEEVLRFRSPAKMLVRVAAADTELAGHVIRQGQLIVAWITAANHDDMHFRNPEAFDIGRAPNPHLAFGHGIHFCLGAALARLEARIALETLLACVPTLHRVPGTSLEPIDSFILSGIKHYPIELTPT
jgi:cytochrome P450